MPAAETNAAFSETMDEQQPRFYLEENRAETEEETVSASYENAWRQDR